MSRKKQYRSGGGADDESAVLKPLKELEQFEPLYDLKHTQIFSTFNPDIIEDALTKQLESMEVKYTAKKDKYKIKFDLESTDPKGVQSVVGICVRILRVEEEKFVIEFTKTGGDENTYLSHFKEFKTGTLGALNDANLVEASE